MKLKNSLKNFIIFMLIIVTFTPLIITGALVLNSLESFFDKDILIHNNTIAGTLSNEIDYILHEPYYILNQIRINIDENGFINEDNTNLYISSIIKNHNYFESIEILDNNGTIKNIAPFNNEFIGISRASQNLYLCPKISGTIYWSQTFISLQTNQPTITLSIPCKDRIIVGYLNLKVLGDIIENLKVHNGSYVAILDQNGTYIAHTIRSKVYKRETEKYFNTFKENTNKSNEILELKYDQDDMLITTSNVDSINWMVVVYQSVDEAYSSIKNVRRILINIIMFSLSAVFIISFWTIKSIITPLNRLGVRSSEISKGQYDILIPYDSFSEFNNLAEHFNSMANNIKMRENENIMLNQELEQRVIERTKKLELANKELESFSYSVSHDLRTPLRGIDGFSQALVEDYSDKLDDTGLHYLNRIRTATQRMGELIDDLLNLSRIGRSDLYYENVDLSRIVLIVADQLKNLDSQRIVEFVIEQNITAYGDKRLLTNVIENLLNNAWKFTSKHVNAKIEFGAIKKGEEKIFYIKDDGCGFDMTYCDKIFGSFQRLHQASDFEGNGIGLANVHRIITRHSGKIWAESVIEQGTTFFFTLS